MTHTELRVGNLYQEKGIYYTVTPVDILNLCKCEAHKVQSDMEPVVLTPEILLKLGFGRKNEKYFLIENKGAAHSIYIEFEFADSDVCGTFWIGRNATTKMFLNIEFVHELQNFVFCLIGKELEIQI